MIFTRRIARRTLSLFVAASSLLPWAGPIAAEKASYSKETELQPVCPQRLGPAGSLELQHVLEVMKLASLGSQRLTSFADEVAKAYELTSDCELWIRDGKPTLQAAQLMDSLARAAEKGLDPSDYDGHWGTLQVFDFRKLPVKDEVDAIRFDVSLTAATIRYVFDLHSGRANPNSAAYQQVVQEKQLDLARFIVYQCVGARDLSFVLETIEPPFLAYRRTLSALATYRRLLSGDEPPNLSVPVYPVEPGIPYKDVVRLQQRLYTLGDLSGSPSKDPKSYDVYLAQAVARFQQRHGLEPSGRLDAATVRELNAPLAKRVRQLELTLERWRWLPPSYSAGPIVVNIPEFRLHIVDEQHHVVTTMNVVVGRAYRHETPVFQGTINSILFRPPWNVPLEIQRRELVPLIEEDPDYLEKNSYDVLDRLGAPIPDSMSFEETIAGLKDGRLFLRQRPGDGNSLGLIKFDLPNPYNVYLHGTPEQELFSKVRRDFSHGCVRVEDPVALAAWLLQANSGWTQERIEEAMHGEETQRVALVRPVPIWVVYGTAVVLEDGRVRFFRDVYGQDAALEEQLEQVRREERFAP